MPHLEQAKFQMRANVDDGFGNKVGVWTDRFDERVSIRYLRGSEAVMAARLEGWQPIVVTVRANDMTDRVTTDWRVIVKGTPYNVREPLRPTDQRRREYEFLAESGVADG